MSAMRELTGAPVRGLPLGRLFATLAAAMGVRSCEACRHRAAVMDTWVEWRWPWDPAANCRSFTGRCTGFGSKQCVTAPAAFTPDALVVEQCCSGWFQYPWITVCEGQQPTRGCGFCLW